MHMTNKLNHVIISITALLLLFKICDFVNTKMKLYLIELPTKLKNDMNDELEQAN